MTGFWKKPELPAALAGALLLLAAAAFTWQFLPAFGGWFYREDSRFFANGLFSFYDLWSAFATPANSMGQYRPVTKLLWGLPQWLGVFSPWTCHAITFSLLAGAALLITRLHYLLFGDKILAVFAGFLFAVLPVNAKALYWISAWHNTAAAFFVLATLCLRFQQWRDPIRETLWRRLGWLTFILAIASREVAFAFVPVLLFVDWQHGKLSRSRDLLLITGFFLVFIFVIEPPFERAHVRPDLSQLFRPLVMVPKLWDYVRSSTWSLGDNLEWTSHPFRLAMSGLLLLLASAGLFRRELRLSALIAWAGVGPYLILDGFSAEYPALMGAGLVLLFCGMLSFPFRRRPITAFLAVLLLGSGYLLYLQDSRKFYSESYAGRSLLLQEFIGRLGAFSVNLPPYRRIYITDFGAYRDGEANETHHFLHPGLDLVLPGHVYLFTNDSLGINDGVGIKNPLHKIWPVFFPGVDPPVRIRYNGEKFEVEHD